MKISFLICTRNRESLLVKSLDSVMVALGNVPGLFSEIIVVDNASEDGTARVLQEWSQANAGRSVEISLLYNPVLGLASSRNMAFAKSAGDIIVFSDDDCILTVDYVKELVEHYRSEAGPVIVGGRVELGSERDLNFTTKTEDEAVRLEWPMHPGGFVHGCNMTCSRSVIERIGGFDERFGAGAIFRAAEDTDFVYRGWAAGIPVCYVPDMSVRHYHGRRDVRAIGRLHWNYQFGNGALYAKHVLRRPSLLKHVAWAARNAVRELLGGRTFDNPNGLTWRSVVGANITGFLAYFGRSTRDRVSRTSQRLRGSAGRGRWADVRRAMRAVSPRQLRRLGPLAHLQSRLAEAWRGRRTLQLQGPELRPVAPAPGRAVRIRQRRIVRPMYPRRVGDE